MNENEHTHCRLNRAQNNVNSENIDPNYLKRFKIFVAMAVIRSKPADRNGKEHAEYLASAFFSAQHGLKGRLVEAKEEILHLKQQVLMSASTNGKDNLEQEHQSIYPTPPSSNETTSRHHSVKQNLHHDITFLQHILSIHRIATVLIAEDSVQRSSEASTDLMLNNVTKDTLEHSLGSICELLADSANTFSTSLIPQALTSVVRLLERVPPDLWYIKCRNLLMDIMSIVINKLIALDLYEEASEIPQVRMSELLQCFYLTNSLDILQGAITLLCHHVELFCTSLRDSEHELCPVAAENMHRLLTSLDSCILENKALLSSKDGRAVCVAIQDNLEQSLLNVTLTHPLLAHAVWRVSNCLQLCIFDTSEDSRLMCD